jgi:hypothetical protein
MNQSLLTPKIEWAAAAVVLVLGLFNAGSALNHGVWVDEFYTLGVAQRSDTFGAFLDQMHSDQHPLGHYGLIALAYSLGVTEIPSLRALNLIGLLFVALGFYVGLRHKSITSSQTCVILAGYCSSTVFIDYLSELRGYFILYSCSLGLAITLHTFLCELEFGKRPSRFQRLSWFVFLLGLTNFHYFGTILGGIATLGLATAMIIKKRHFDALIISVISAFAATPALMIAASQLPAIGGTFWIKTSASEAVSMFRESIASQGNLPLRACALVACLWALQDRKWLHAILPGLRLLIMIAAFFVLLLALNELKPLIQPRYLTAGAGFILVGVVLIGIHNSSPKFAPLAAIAFALLFEVHFLISGRFYYSPGWLTSATAVQAEYQACPETRVYAALYVGTLRNEIHARSWATGYQYYAAKMGFPYTELRRDEVIEASPSCPTIIWMEHISDDANVGVGAVQILENMRTRTALDPIRAEVRRVGSGLLIIWRNSSIPTQ